MQLRDCVYLTREDSWGCYRWKGETVAAHESVFKLGPWAVYLSIPKLRHAQ